MKKSEIRKLISESIVEVLYEQTLPDGISPNAVMTLDQFVQGSVDEAEGDFLGARTKPVSPEEMQAYMDRIKSKKKEKTDKYTMPYIHGSNIEIKNDAGKTYDQDKLKNRYQDSSKDHSKAKRKDGKKFWSRHSIL